MPAQLAHPNAASSRFAAIQSRMPPRARRGVSFARELAQQIGEDRLQIVAAGVAFYALLGLFPALGALISIFGLVLDPRQVTEQVQALQGVVPEEAMRVLSGQLERLTSSGRTALGLGLAVSLGLTLWSASAGVKIVVMALNVAYDVEETRGFFRRTATALLLTLGGIVGAVVAMATVIVLPAVIQFLGLQSLLAGVISYARWPILALLTFGAFAALYRFAPSRPRPSWRAVARGALVAAGLWIFGSAMFSWYVSNFGRYNETYGTVAAIVILLMWLLLTAWSILLGAEVNALRERREAGDSPRVGEGDAGERHTGPGRSTNPDSGL